MSFCTVIRHVADELRIISPSSVAVGSFDGLHLGHRALINRLKEIAAERDTASLVVTFDPHPRLVLAPDSDFRLLTTTREKQAILSKLGIDYSAYIPFDDPYYNRKTYGRFVKWLQMAFDMESLLIGYNHRFGLGGKGGAHNIDRLANKYGFESEVFGQHLVDGMSVSSSEVRRVISDGDMVLAAKLLGEPYLAILDKEIGGIWHSDHPAKLLPPPDIYRVVANGYECECLVREDGTIKISQPLHEKQAHVLFIDKYQY